MRENAGKEGIRKISYINYDLLPGLGLPMMSENTYF